MSQGQTVASLVSAPLDLFSPDPTPSPTLDKAQPWNPGTSPWHSFTVLSSMWKGNTAWAGQSCSLGFLPERQQHAARPLWRVIGKSGLGPWEAFALILGLALELPRAL